MVQQSDVREAEAALDDRRQAHAFACILHEADRLTTAEEVLYFFGKPYKWSQAYLAWLETGTPTSDTQETWAAFLARLDDLGE